MYWARRLARYLDQACHGIESLYCTNDVRHWRVKKKNGRYFVVAAHDEPLIGFQKLKSYCDFVLKQKIFERICSDSELQNQKPENNNLGDLKDDHRKCVGNQPVDEFM